MWLSTVFGLRNSSAGSVLAGLSATLVVDTWLGVVEGDGLLNAAAPELLPEPVGGIGQLMPPGAGANLLRSTGFFDGSGSGKHVAVLAVWAVVGLAVLLVAEARGRVSSPRSHLAHAS
jgi:hypothetical protein